MRLGNVITINPESIRNGYPFDEIEYIDISSVGTGMLQGTQRLQIDDAPSRAKRIVRNGDTLLATVRPNLRSFWFARNPKKNTIASTGFAVLRAGKDIDARFVYFTVTNQPFTDYLTANAKGAAYPAVDTDTIARAEIYLPPLPTQRKIAAILSAYDDLIENNLRRIKILEEMAQNLYREWFIHFRYPIHFRDPGSEPSTQPESHPSPTGRRDRDEGRAKLVDSPLGRISVGWNVVNFGELYITSSGGTPSRKVAEYYGGAHPWIKTRELNDGFILETEETITDLGLIKSSAKLFPENTVILAIYGATIGKLGILSMPSATNQACVAILQKEVGFGRAFAFLFLLENRDKLIGLGQGAAQQNISQVVLKNFPAFRPPVSLMQAFSVMVEPLLDNVRNLQHKNTTLRRTRDLMLPKLISGEVDVSELDIAIPEEDNKV
jgi:type I restriction enzyme S subunit